MISMLVLTRIKIRIFQELSNMVILVRRGSPLPTRTKFATILQAKSTSLSASGRRSPLAAKLYTVTNL